MPTRLFLDTANSFDSGNQFEIVNNPTHPKGMIVNQPAKKFPTLTGPGGIQAPKSWFPDLLFQWPALVKSNVDHAELFAAFQARQFIKTGVNHFIGILAGDSKDNGFPFWNAAKFIEIRILEVIGPELPVENDLDEILFDMMVSAIWIDPD